MSEIKHYPIVVGGDLIEEGSRELVNPATGKKFATVASANLEHVNKVIKAAINAQKEWSKITVGERSALLMKLADALEEKSKELADMESLNTGKPIKLTKGGDVPFSIDNIRYFASAVRHQEGVAAGEYVSGYTSMLRREPIGVVVDITPWNYPLMMAAWKIGPALATGNAVIIKPASNTPLTTIELAKTALEIGLPEGLINVIVGSHEVAENLCSNNDVGMINFTGSTLVGIRIMEIASKTIKKVTLELGGKAPFVVFSDADIEGAAQGGVVASFYNTGQDCTAATRIYVQEDSFDQYVERFLKLTKNIKFGAPFDKCTDIGPLISEEHRQRVHKFVEGARKQGIEVLIGGEIPEGEGYFYPPTIIVNAPQESSCVQDEIFGPVIVINKFKDEDEAIKLSNDVKFGLAASVWTKETQRAMRVSAALEYGCVWVNDHMILASEMPHGGFKQSGLGKDLSHYALEEHTIVKHVCFDNTGDTSKEWYRLVLSNID